jgi:hypothetical protein
MPQRLRIFISSPGDVPDERLRADLVIDKLAQDYSRFFARSVLPFHELSGLSTSVAKPP